jgi:hypothetical protein
LDVRGLVRIRVFSNFVRGFWTVANRERQSSKRGRWGAVSVSGKTVFVMLFGVAVAVSIDPLAGLFAFLALLAATNPQRVVQMLYALDDSVQRAQRLLEERRWPALASGDEGATDAGESVTTQCIDKEEAAVVTPTQPHRASADCASIRDCHNTAYK